MKVRQMKLQSLLGYAFGCILVILILIAAAETVKVVKQTPGRSGPGSYYELKTLIPPSASLAVLGKEKGWLKVTFENQEVWISENSLLEETGGKENPFSKMSFEGARVSASPIAVSAAIKGFWTRYTGADKSNLAEVPVDGYDIPPFRFEAFENEHARTVSRDNLFKKYKLSKKYRSPRMPYVKEQQIGYTVASSVAEGTLLENENIINYVYSVGWYLADATERPDIKYIFFILDTDRVNAISCPGGYIMLTRGLLQLLDDESELAALLAHEMGHVIAGHGTRELEDKFNRIAMQAEDAFANLDSQTGGVSETEKELSSIAIRAATICRSPKLDAYEFEADEMALLYMARSGYDLGGELRLLNKLKTKHDREVDIFDINYRNHPDFGKRLNSIDKVMKNYKNYSGQTFSAGFKESMVF